MVARGKSINLFLMDGESDGRIKCTLANWTGVAYKIPRTELDKCRDRDDLSRSGVYFLFGISDDTEDSVVYIGQAGIRKTGEGILNRLFEHKRNPEKDYWTEAVVFTTSNNSFGPTEISYLENRFSNMALVARRYIVKNGNDPNPGNLTEEKESELEEFIDNAKIVMGTLGHKVFDPYVQPPTAGEAASRTDEVFYTKRSGTEAKAIITGEGVVVLAGSKIRGEETSGCPESARRDREKYAEYVDGDHRLIKDILFRTPSGASCFVVGSSSNGTLDWKRESDNKTLKDIESSGL